MAFWQPVRLEIDEIESPDPKEKIALPTRESSPPPPYPYLANFRDLIPRLRQALVAQRNASDLDLPRIVDRLSHAEFLHRLPRRRRFGWGSSLYVIEDRCDHLAPYLRDQAMVSAHLAGLYPDFAFHPTLYNEFHPYPLEELPDGSFIPIQPLPGDQVLVLSDLGRLARDGGCAMGFWLSFGRELRALGVRTIALVPPSVDEYPPVFFGVYGLLGWEHPSPKALSEEEKDAYVEPLLDQLSIVNRIEPGLLRTIRLSLGAGELPACLEAWAWQHPAMASPDMVATSLQITQVKDRRQAFEWDIRHRQGTLSAARDWLKHRPYSLWLEGVIEASAWAEGEGSLGVKQGDGFSISSRERNDAEQLLHYLAERANADDVGRWEAVCLDGFWQRAANTASRDRKIRDAYWRFNNAMKRREKGLPPPTSGEPRRWALYQQGSRVQFLPEDTKDVSASPIAVLHSINGLVETNTESFWKSGSPPSWAVDWGEDSYGLWVAFELRGVRQRLRWCPPGRFQMGSPEAEPGRFDREGPQHEVTLREGFWLFDTPVTQGLWMAVMGEENNPSRFQDPDRPVERVSWYDCQLFLTRINAQIPDLALALPSEAEWEYACRARTGTALYNGPINYAPALDAIAWYGGNSGVGFELEDGWDSSGWLEKQYPHNKAGTHPVARKEPNAWGLYDMLGNVWDWTQDQWHDNYRGAPIDGLPWEDLENRAHRVYRGGSWFSDARNVRVAFRRYDLPDFRDDALGFRCCARVHVVSQPSQEVKRVGEMDWGPLAAVMAPAEPAPATRRARRGATMVLRRSEKTSIVDVEAPVMDTLKIRSDCEVLTLRHCSRPSWASAMGRDGFGLWAEFRHQGIVQRLRWCPPGRFRMGSPEDEPGRYDDEGPQHEVTLSKGFWLFDTPVTQGLWMAVMGEENNPSRFQDPDRPVENVNWNDCQGFINLNSG